MSKLSRLTRRMLPKDVYENKPKFVLFVQKFFEYLERENGEYDVIKNLVNSSDIDNVVDDYLGFYKKQYADLFPNTMQADFRVLVKQLKAFYSSKGTEKSIEFLFRAIFNATVEFYYPKDDILRTSDGTWYQPTYLLVGNILDPSATTGFSRTDFNGNKIASVDLLSLVDHKIQGVTSGATAYIDDRVQLSFQYPEIIDNHNFDNSNDEFLFDAGVIHNINTVSKELTLDRNGSAEINNQMYQNFTTLEQPKTYTLTVNVKSLTAGSRILININGTDHEITNTYVNTVGRLDIDFNPNQSSGGDDITINIVDNINGVAVFSALRLTVQGLTYPLYTISLSDIAGTFIVDEEIRVTDDEIDNFQIVRPNYDIETGLLKPTGAYLDNNGFLSDTKYLQDSYYYQEFSYELQSDIEPDLYTGLIKDLVHPAGFRMFGKLNVDTLQFVSLDDLRVFNTWLIEWIQAGEIRTEGVIEADSSTEYSERYRYSKVQHTDDYNEFAEHKEDPKWDWQDNDTLDGYTFQQFEAMQSENQVLVFVDGLKIPSAEYSVLGTSISFDNAPPTGLDNVEIYMLDGLQLYSPTYEVMDGVSDTVIYYDNLMKNATRNIFVCIDGKLQTPDKYTFLVDGIQFNTTPPNLSVVDIFTITGNLNRDIHGTSGDSINIDTHYNLPNYDRDKLLHNQTIINSLNPSNLFFFLDGVKSKRFFFTEEKEFITLVGSSASPTTISITSLNYQSSIDITYISGNGTTTDYVMNSKSSFVIDPFALVDIDNVEKLVNNSEFNSDPVGELIYDGSFYSWYDNNTVRSLTNDNTEHSIQFDNLNIAQNDKLKIEIYATSLVQQADYDLGDVCYLYIGDTGFNNLAPTVENNKRIDITGYETSKYLETVLEVTNNSQVLDIVTANLIEIDFIRVWKQI